MRFDLDMPAWKWPFYVARHPFEGFEDLRWKKAYSMRVSLVIVLCFNTSYVKVFNIVPLLVQTIVLFFTWVIGNWSLCTLFDGEGSMKNICCISAYALVPYLITQIVVIIASNVLLMNESAFILFFQYFGIVWSVVLMISGMKTVHQYSVPKTLAAMFFTVLAMVIILFLLVLLMSLFQQVYVFGFSIYTELMYRFSI